ncbi:MAG: hypothetical protein HZA90_24380 [Verrucomicrobia bacterium]|nr:hypothetical protein [Verrucomicrobiota bacterium]
MTPPDRARAYLAKLPPAISGQGGHAATFAAACRLVEFDVAEADALEILKAWNLTHCQPPWTEAELRHKLADAYRTTAPRACFAARNFLSPCPLSSPLPPSRRPALPPLRAGTAQDFAALASRRGLAADGLRLASARGLLRFGGHRTRAAWFILDGTHRMAQARRLDGQPWTPDAKAWTLAGSKANWPVGADEARPFAVVAFCEGGPDLLAAHCFIAAEARGNDCAAVAMLGGCARIHPDALPLFRGKRIRLFPHVDDTGQDAAKRWAAQLADAGAEVDAFNLAGLRRTDGEPVKDFNDLAAIHADDFEQHRCLWNLFP